MRGWTLAAVVLALWWPTVAPGWAGPGLDPHRHPGADDPPAAAATASAAPAPPLPKPGRAVAAQAAAEATLLTRWPVVNGRVRVAYTISSLTDSTITATLTQAMAHWSANACVDFVSATAADAGYVEVAAGAGTDCRATVGYGPGALPLWLTGACSFGSIVHELGHVLGLYHEHSRWDRDRWVEFHAENVASGSSSEYAISGDSYAFGLYDYSSIMHYGPYAFWGGTGSTLFASVVVGQRTGLTARDVALVRWLYNNCSSQPQAAIQCAANYDAFAYVVRPGRPFSLNIVGYYQPQALTLTFALPSGASANLASPYTAPASDSIVSLRVTWTPTSAQLGTHTVQTTFSTAGGPSRACDFQVTVAASACDGHAGDPASDCSGHGRCTMASPAWPCECDVGHYGRLCEAAYMCPATLAETFDSGLGRFYAVAAGVAVAAGYLQMAQPGASSAAYLTGISLTPAAVEVSVWVGPSIPASGIAASLLCGNPSYLTLAALQIQNGAFQAVAAGFAAPLSAVTPVANRWYTLRIAFDYQRRSFKYLIDGTFYLELSLDSSQTGTSAYLAAGGVGEGDAAVLRGGEGEPLLPRLAPGPLPGVGGPAPAGGMLPGAAGHAAGGPRQAVREAARQPTAVRRPPQQEGRPLHRVLLRAGGLGAEDPWAVAADGERLQLDPSPVLHPVSRRLHQHSPRWPRPPGPRPTSSSVLSDFPTASRLNISPIALTFRVWLSLLCCVCVCDFPRRQAPNGPNWNCNWLAPQQPLGQSTGRAWAAPAFLGAPGSTSVC